MAGLQDHLVSGQRQARLQQALRLAFEGDELLEQPGYVGGFEGVLRLLDLVLEEDIAIGHALDVDEIEYRIDVLQIHAHPFETVGDLAGDGVAVEASDLLEVGELRDLHAVEPYLPAESPCAECRVLPVVLDETHVVLREIEAQHLERAQVELEDVRGRGLQHDLELVVLMQAVRILSVAPILRPPRRLHVRGPPGLRPQRAQERGGVRCSSADLDVVRLQQRAALPTPIVLKGENNLLEREHRWRRGCRRRSYWISHATRHRNAAGSRR